MRGTALVVLLCLLAAVAAHVLSEDARARSLAADEVGLPTDCDFTPCPSADLATPDDAAPAATDDATTRP